MSEMLSHVNAISIFLAIAAFGFLFLLISLVFGGIFDHVEFSHDFDHDLSHGGPGILSTRIISVFVTAFGGFGAIGIYEGYGVFASSFFGTIGGVILAGLIVLFARFLYSQQASSTISSSDLVGRSAQVTVGIPAGGLGQVRCLVGETMLDKMARSRDGVAIPSNSLVKVEEVVGESVVVSLVSGSRPYADISPR
jgi:hypothetical protein